MPNELKPYMCKHFKWTSWTHYGSKMYEFACKLKGGGIGTCKGCCEKFERRANDEQAEFANRLYNNCYRKSTDAAREIFEGIERALNLSKRYCANLLPKVLFMPDEIIKRYILAQKQKMLCMLMEDHPASVYEAVFFEIESNEGEIYNAIEDCFKKADGRYIYNGKFVSREFLWERFKNLPCRIKMTVHVREENLKNAKLQ